jgi:predicted Zn-dependent peptidase
VEGGARRLMGVFDRQTLPNGLRLLTAPIEHAQSVSCFVMLSAGSRFETPDTSGIAHFAEHMFFKGTERRPSARDIGSEVDGIGGEFNAFTGKEYTGYYVRCAGEHRSVALDVLVDMLRHSKFDADEIEREKGVIVEEMNMYFDTPRDYISGVYDDLLYGDQPLGWDIIGRKETVRAATRETFLDYTGRWYKPKRMVVGVAGMIGDRLEDEIQRLLGDLEPGETGDPAPAVLSENGANVKIYTKASDQAHLCIGVRSYPLVHPDRYALQLLGTVLGTGMSSRLFTEVRERRGLAYYVYAINHSYTDAGSLYSQAGVDIERIDEAVSTIVTELRKIADDPVPADELEKARNVAKGRFVLQTESPHGLIMFGLRREVLEGQTAEPEEILAGLDAVTAEDVQRVAQDIIGEGEQSLKLALIGPFEQDQQERFEKLLA